MKLSKELVSMKNIKVLSGGEFKMSIRRNVHFDKIKCILLKDIFAKAQTCTRTSLEEKKKKLINTHIHIRIYGK